MVTANDVYKPELSQTEPSFSLLITLCSPMKVKVGFVLSQDIQQSQTPDLLHSVCLLME